MIERSISRFLQYLYEMARVRAKTEEKIRNYCKPITNHVIKLLKWRDDYNYKKHLEDIDVYIHRVSEYKYQKKKRPDTTTYYELLFEDRISDLNYLSGIIKYDLKNYHELPVIRSDEQVYEIMKKIMWNIASDLSTKKYKTAEVYFTKYT
jgi:hypothetical protein